MKVDFLIVKRWLDKAENDMGFAASALNDPENRYYGLICFHYQQAAEKYLKAYIVAYDLKFEKNHNLLALMSICAKKHSAFKKLKDDCFLLNDYYIEPRYPTEIPKDRTKDEALQAKEAAERIGGFVKKLLMSHGG